MYCEWNFKTHVSKGEIFVLKTYSKLIRAEIWKLEKRLYNIFWRPEFCFHIFLRFYGPRSLQIRAVFFHTTKTRIDIDFRRYGRSLKPTLRYGPAPHTCRPAQRRSGPRSCKDLQIELSRLLCLIYLFLLYFQCKSDILYNQIDSTSSDLFQRSLVNLLFLRRERGR